MKMLQQPLRSEIYKITKALHPKNPAIQTDLNVFASNLKTRGLYTEATEDEIEKFDEITDRI